MDFYTSNIEEQKCKTERSGRFLRWKEQYFIPFDKYVCLREKTIFCHLDRKNPHKYLENHHFLYNCIGIKAHILSLDIKAIMCYAPKKPGGTSMTDMERKKAEIKLLFEFLTPEEQEAYLNEVWIMLLKNSRKAEFDE